MVLKEHMTNNKVEKSKIEQNICVLLIKMQHRAFSLIPMSKNKWPPNYNNKQATLRAHGFTEAKWVVAPESDDSYTLWASPGRPFWKKGAWASTSLEPEAPFLEVSVSSAPNAPLKRICCKLQGFYKKIMMDKKSEKSETEQFICVLQIKMQKVSKSTVFLQSRCWATKLQQQKTHPGASWLYRGKMGGSPWKWR